jgi:uncharacterized protein involved in exopolysaccharide biosynthesis
MTPPIVKRFLIAFEQHKLLGAFIFLLILGVSGIFALQPAPPQPKTTYKGTGELSYSSPPPLFTSTGEQLQQQGRQVGINILNSPIVLENVRKKTGIISRTIQKNY